MQTISSLMSLMPNWLSAGVVDIAKLIASVIDIYKLYINVVIERIMWSQDVYLTYLDVGWCVYYICQK